MAKSREQRTVGDTSTEHQSEEDLLITEEQWVPVSAINQMNVEHLKDKLYATVLDQKIGLESTIVSNVRHFEALQKGTAEPTRSFTRHGAWHQLRFCGNGYSSGASFSRRNFW